MIFLEFICFDLPASPILSPHFGFEVLVRLEVFTVVTIASINLLHKYKYELDTIEYKGVESIFYALSNSRQSRRYYVDVRWIKIGMSSL
jgi:ketol-acid reductoisomerase